MGDFDRRENTGKKNESKKIVMVAILGVMLLGLVWFQFAKKSPAAVASATADPATGAAAPQAVRQTPEVAMAWLAQDPTAGLLDTKSIAGASAVPPRNPFVMSAAWRAAFVKEVAAPQPEKNNTPSGETPHPQPASTPLSLSPESYKLNGIMQQGSTLYAIINSKILTTGNVVGKARVIEIRPDSVSLQHVDSPDGPLLELSSHPVDN